MRFGLSSPDHGELGRGVFEASVEPPEDTEDVHTQPRGQEAAILEILWQLLLPGEFIFFVVHFGAETAEKIQETWAKSILKVR